MDKRRSPEIPKPPQQRREYWSYNLKKKIGVPTTELLKITAVGVH